MCGKTINVTYCVCVCVSLYSLALVILHANCLLFGSILYSNFWSVWLYHFVSILSHKGKERTGYSHLKEEALNRTMWRAALEEALDLS